MFRDSNSYFYPRSPCGERLLGNVEAGLHTSFLSTLSLRRATRGEHHANSQQEFLSTLSLRRATRLPTALRTPHHRFLSTLSLRRATCVSSVINNVINNFYPRSPCGERPLRRNEDCNYRNISIHALLAESDGVFLLLGRLY